jgi:hypothetical protein
MTRSRRRRDRRGGKPSSMWRGQHSPEVCPPRPPSLVVEVGGQHSSVAAHDDRGRCSHPRRVCRGQCPTAAPDRTPERVSTRRHREGTRPLQVDCTVTPCLPALMQAPVTGASGKRSRSLPFCQPHRSRTGPCWRRSQGPTSSSQGPPTMNRAVQLATVRRARQPMQSADDSFCGSCLPRQQRTRILPGTPGGQALPRAILAAQRHERGGDDEPDCSRPPVLPGNALTVR